MCREAHPLLSVSRTLFLIAVVSKSERLVSRCLRHVDVALARLEGGQPTYPGCAVEGGIAHLPFHDISIFRIEACEGRGDRHALARRESYPRGSLVDGDHIIRGIHRNACQRKRAGGTHLDHVHLTEVESHAC